MSLPFSTEQFFNVFASYNNAIFPFQFIFLATALFILFVIFKKLTGFYTLIWAVLAFYWGWMGIVYHLYFFSPINPIAKVFGLLFIVQAFLFFFFGVIKKNIEFAPLAKSSAILAGFLFIYALVIYPVITIASGHRYPAIPTFGVPCPTTIFTFGIFLLINLKKTPKTLYIIPILWTFIATTAAIKLDVYADILLIITSFLFITKVVTANQK